MLFIGQGIELGLLPDFQATPIRVNIALQKRKVFDFEFKSVIKYCVIAPLTFL